MKTNIPPYKTIDEYIAFFPSEVQKKLQEIRETIKKLAPEAQEKISYGIPTFYLNGNLVHFAAYDMHIGFYPGAKAIITFEDELTQYKTSKGTVQFPLTAKLPLGLIKKIVKLRVKENQSK